MCSMTLCHLSVGQKPFSYLLTKGSNATFTWIKPEPQAVESVSAEPDLTA